MANVVQLLGPPAGDRRRWSRRPDGLRALVTSASLRVLDSPVGARTVAVVDGLPAFRRGLAAGLAEHGFDVEELARPPEFGAAHAVVALTVGSADDWSLLGRLRALRPAPAVTVLLSEPRVACYRRALRLGAAGVVARDAAIEEIVAVIEAAEVGSTLLPQAIVRQLLEAGDQADDSLPVSECERGWLRALANGATIGRLAEAANYSERQMHRLIRCLYLRMGVSTREEAIVLAARWGVLD
jgi:DNA-binding NarL/FixJ family response regulator